MIFSKCIEKSGYHINPVLEYLSPKEQTLKKKITQIIYVDFRKTAHQQQKFPIISPARNKHY